jgi:hypothetical protein
MAEEPTSSCRRCGAANPAQNRFCGRCGEFLQSAPSANLPLRGRSSESLAALEKAPAAPAKVNTASRILTSLGAVGKPLAVGALALGAEAAVMWLGRQAQRKAPGSLPTIPPADPVSRVETLGLEGYLEEVLFVFAQQDRAARSGGLYVRRSGLTGRSHVGR